MLAILIVTEWLLLLLLLLLLISTSSFGHHRVWWQCSSSRWWCLMLSLHWESCIRSESSDIIRRRPRAWRVRGTSHIIHSWIGCPHECRCLIRHWRFIPRWWAGLEIIRIIRRRVVSSGSTFFSSTRAVLALTGMHWSLWIRVVSRCSTRRLLYFKTVYHCASEARRGITSCFSLGSVFRLIPVLLLR